jgi:CheY-like chemotaxis protein
METRLKILLVDDDPAVLELYQELLKKLPSKPEIVATSSGARAMALLENDSFRLMICDLKMPKMDGLQVLSIVRRKYPMLRTVALTAILDEQFRSRAYALGVDLFWHKPTTEQEVQMFLECLESLLGQENENGFRGVQSKSLMDIIQLECISQSSSLLRIANGSVVGRIWIQDGEVIDSETSDFKGEEAFYRILAWRTGTFESMAPEPNRERTIYKSYNALLLESAQALDEALSAGGETDTAHTAMSPLSRVAQMEGVEFVLAQKRTGVGKAEARGLENPDRLANWSRQCLQQFADLSELIHAGPLELVEGSGPQRQVSLARQGDFDLCVGWKHDLSSAHIRDTMKKVTALWAS